METATQINNDFLKEVIALLTKAQAHVSFDDAIKDVPFQDLGKKPDDVPYSIWQLTDHIRIAQHDILEFSTNKNYKEKNWPADYWVKETAPESEAQWTECIDAIQKDRDAFIQLLKDKSDELLIPFEHGNGQNLLREAFLIADHNSYHTGEIIIIRRLLGNWKK